MKIVHAVPRAEGPNIVYPLGIVAGHDRPEVRRFYDYLTSDAAGAVFAGFGFIVLGAEHDD